MSIIDVHDKRLNKYFERIAGNNEYAKEKSEGDEYKYLGEFIELFLYANTHEEGFLDVCLDVLTKSCHEKNYPFMQATMNFMNKSKLLWQLGGGYDHSSMAYEIVPYLSSADYSNLFRALPRGLPLTANGYSMHIHMANLLFCLLYQDDYDTDAVVEAARKYIVSKHPKWDRAGVACLLGIIEEDMEMLSINLQTLCQIFSRNDMSKFDKIQCQYAYGLLSIAYNNLPLEKYKMIQLPKYKNFDAGYINWLIKGNLTEEKFIEYQKPYEILNTAISAPIPITKICQPYLNERVPARERLKIWLDLGQMNRAVVDYVWQNGR